MPFAPGGWQGITNRPVRAHTVWANNDVLLQMTFLNSSKVPTEPSAITYRMDSLTSVQNVIPLTSVTPTGSEMVLQIPALYIAPTRQWYGGERFQVWIQAEIPDTNATSGTIQVNKLVVLELAAESVPC